MSKKKWLVAVFFSKRDEILKSWSGKVSYALTADDVTVPENTVFYFFSTCEKVEFKLTQINLSQEVTIAFLNEIKKLVHEGKLYCSGRKKDNSIIVRCGNIEVSSDDFIEFARKNNLTVEMV